MVRHIVLFKFKTSASEVQIKELENGLGSLPGIIREIRGYEFGRNIVKSERAYDFALVSAFDDLDSLRKYISHPEHQRVLKHINEICDSIKSVDYESLCKNRCTRSFPRAPSGNPFYFEGWIPDKSIRE